MRDILLLGLVLYIVLNLIEARHNRELIHAHLHVIEQRLLGEASGDTCLTPAPDREER